MIIEKKKILSTSSFDLDCIYNLYEELCNFNESFDRDRSAEVFPAGLISLIAASDCL